MHLGQIVPLEVPSCVVHLIYSLASKTFAAKLNECIIKRDCIQSSAKPTGYASRMILGNAFENKADKQTKEDRINQGCKQDDGFIHPSITIMESSYLIYCHFDRPRLFLNIYSFYLFISVGGGWQFSAVTFL